MAGHLATGGYDADYGHAEGDFEKAEQLRGEITCVPDSANVVESKAECNEALFKIIYQEQDYSVEGNDCRYLDGVNYVTVTDCDCSDPDNYDFYDEGSFLIRFSVRKFWILY